MEQNTTCTTLYELHLWACIACSLLSVTNSLPLHSLALLWTCPSFPASSSSCCWGNKQHRHTVYSIAYWGSGRKRLWARCQKHTGKWCTAKRCYKSQLRCRDCGIYNSLMVVRVCLERHLTDSSRFESKLQYNKPFTNIKCVLSSAVNGIYIRFQANSTYSWGTIAFQVLKSEAVTVLSAQIVTFFVNYYY